MFIFPDTVPICLNLHSHLVRTVTYYENNNNKLKLLSMSSIDAERHNDLSNIYRNLFYDEIFLAQMQTFSNNYKRQVFKAKKEAKSIKESFIVLTLFMNFVMNL